MTLNEQYNKWKENTLKKSLEKFKERKERFEYSSGLEVPRLSLPPEVDSAYEEKLGFPGEYPLHPRSPADDVSFTLLDDASVCGVLDSRRIQ